MMYVNQAQKERQRLFNWITMVSFMVDDIHLYLNTHPCDKEALEHYEHYRDMRMQAMKEYSKSYGPLTRDMSFDNDTWNWVTQPWPWEGGSC